MSAELRSTHGRTYGHVLGPRAGWENGREEQYAVLFDSEILELEGSKTIVDDPGVGENVCRDPLVVSLKLKETWTTFTFTLIVVHTDPDPPEL